MTTQVLFGFHAVTVRLKMAPDYVLELVVDHERRDQQQRSGEAPANNASCGGEL